jgi:hypothetical protein
MMEKLEDLDFAEDVCLLAQRWSDMKAKFKKLENEAAKVGLKINEFKTKEMRINPSTDLELTVNGREVEQVISFLYLGSTVTTYGGALQDVQSYQEGKWGLCAVVPTLEVQKYTNENQNPVV